MAEVKLIACDNPISAGAKFIGREAKFSYHGGKFFFSSLYSSTVKSIVRDEGRLLVQTRNTLYTFEDVNPPTPDIDEEALLRAMIV